VVVDVSSGHGGLRCKIDSFISYPPRPPARLCAKCERFRHGVASPFRGSARHRPPGLRLHSHPDWRAVLSL